MNYVVKKAGYEYKGFKLGQRVVYEGRETMIIGFDKDTDTYFPFMVASDRGGYMVSTSIYTSVALEGYESCTFEWANEKELTSIEPTQDESNPDPTISKIHAIEIIEDILNQSIQECYVDVDVDGSIYNCQRVNSDGFVYSYPQEQINLIKQCLFILKGESNEPSTDN